MIDIKKDLIIYTDGGARGNPGPGGYGALLAYPLLDEVIELGGSKRMTTNNEMELTAVISALSYAENNAAPTHIFTDSKYVIEGITRWVHGWKKTGWLTQNKTPVAHKELWERLEGFVSRRGERGALTWHHVPGHAGIAGNERVDTIASSFADGKDIPLYRGVLAKYPHDVLSIDVSIIENASQEKKSNSGKAYSYLSVVDNTVMRHMTWDDCKQRVSGTRAKYRKATSQVQEAEILREWGYSLEDIV